MKLILLCALLSVAVSTKFFVKSKTGKYYLVKTQISPKKIGMYPPSADYKNPLKSDSVHRPPQDVKDYLSMTHFIKRYMKSAPDTIKKKYHTKIDREELEN